MKLYTYFRSSAAYRVRIALNLKGAPYTCAYVNLLEGQQKDAQYRATNPQGLVPALELADGHVISQSTAILEYLEETQPSPPLLPTDPLARSTIRSLVNHIACDIHPLNNIAVLNYLRQSLNAQPGQVDLWYSEWVHRGFAGIESLARKGNGQYCVGSEPGMAECYLIPQMYNALRFKVEVSAYPTLLAIYHHCNTLAPFAQAHPDRQADNPDNPD